MDLKIFDVEHGACALLTCDNNARIMVDCGNNATNDWWPGIYLRNNGIAQLEALMVTNYDEDHVSGFPDLIENVNVRWIYRNKSVSTDKIRELKSEDGMGPGIEGLVDALDEVFTTEGEVNRTIFHNMTFKTFMNRYPLFDDENNLSMVLHMKCHGIGFLFPGDLEKAGWLELLRREDFRAALSDTKVLIASHHGRDNGCCAEVFEYCRPYYVVISDKGYMYDTQKTIPFYRGHTIGGPFRGETRRVLTTRKDGRIGFSVSANSWYPY